MGKVGKIESHNLGPRILQLRTEEGKTSYEIATALKADGFTISQATISRWIKRQRDTHHDQVQDIVSDHVARVVPRDMEALEEMESKCLAWTKEEPAEKAERISTWKRVREAVIEIRTMILLMQPDNQDSTVKAFMDRVVGWIMEDINTQKHRINAMRMAANIIDTKLKYSGILDGQAGGNIFIGPADNDSDHSDNNSPEETNHGLYLIKGGDEGNNG